MGSPPLDKGTKNAIKELAKLSEKYQRASVPLQAHLLQVADLPPHPEITRQLTRLKEDRNLLTTALTAVEERALRRGGGFAPQAAKAVSRWASSDMSVTVQEPTAQEQPTLSGSTPAFPLTEVLHLLETQKKSGVLSVTTPEETLTFELFEGDVVWSTTNSPRRGERLGEILIGSGAVSIDHFLAFSDNFKGNGRLLGMALVKQGIVSEDALTAALVEQQRLRFDRALDAESCTFEFFDSTVSQRTGLNISLQEFVGDAAHTKPFDPNTPTTHYASWTDPVNTERTGWDAD